MIDEKALIRWLEKLKAENNGITGLKAPALIDKIISEIVNESIRCRIENGSAK